jgi:signal transduction histidine kinase
LLGYVKLIRDRTDLRAQIDTTAHRLALAEAAVRESGRRLAIAGHELRGPLGTIGNAVLALRQPGLPADKVERLHEIVDRQMEIARRLLHDAVDGGADDATADLTEPGEVELQPILESAADTVRASPIARDRTIELIVPAEPLRIVIDAVRVEQVVRNLIENACKYNDAGGHVWVTATLEGQDAVVRVRDDGIGIAHDQLPRIFEWFVRGDDAGAAGAAGFGIGLGLVRDLVRRLHGTVEVLSSGVTGGSEFTVNLPLRPPSSDG